MHINAQAIAADQNLIDGQVKFYPQEGKLNYKKGDKDKTRITIYYIKQVKIDDKFIYFLDEHEATEVKIPIATKFYLWDVLTKHYWCEVDGHTYTFHFKI